MNLCIPRKAGYGKYRRHIIETLFRGVWDKHDRFRIVDTYGLGHARLASALCNVGLKCLMPQRSWSVLQRKNWTGADVSVATILLPTLVFGIFPTTYLNAMEMTRSRGPGDYVPNPILHIGGSLKKTFVLVDRAFGVSPPSGPGSHGKRLGMQ